MTEQEQFLAMAELDGKSVQMEGCSCPQCLERHQMNYSTRDAVIGVIEKQDRNIARAVCGWLSDKDVDWCVEDAMAALLATPAQLREALLRATGKWKD